MQDFCWRNGHGCASLKIRSVLVRYLGNLSSKRGAPGAFSLLFKPPFASCLKRALANHLCLYRQALRRRFRDRLMWQQRLKRSKIGNKIAPTAGTKRGQTLMISQAITLFSGCGRLGLRRKSSRNSNSDQRTNSTRSGRVSPGALNARSSGVESRLKAQRQSLPSSSQSTRRYRGSVLRTSTIRFRY